MQPFGREGECFAGGIYSEEFHPWKVRRVSWKKRLLSLADKSFSEFFLPQTKDVYDQRHVRSLFAASVLFPFIFAGHRNWHSSSVSSVEFIRQPSHGGRVKQIKGLCWCARPLHKFPARHNCQSQMWVTGIALRMEHPVGCELCNDTDLVLSGRATPSLG